MIVALGGSFRFLIDPSLRNHSASKAIEVENRFKSSHYLHPPPCKI